MTRQIRPEDAHSIAPDIVADAPATPPPEDAGRSALASAAFARGPQNAAALPPLDHAAIHTIIAGIMVAMSISALEQTIMAPALRALAGLENIDDLSWSSRRHFWPRRGDAAVRQAHRYTRPARHHAAGDRHFHSRLARVRARTDHVDSDRWPRPARRRWWRSHSDRADDHRRLVDAARAPDAQAIHRWSS